MDGIVISGYGMDIAVYFAGNDKIYSCARYVVYSGGGAVLFRWGHILSVAQIKILARNMALVRNWGQCVLLFRGAVWMHN